MRYWIGVAIAALMLAPGGPASAQTPAEGGFSIVYNVQAKGLVLGKFSYEVSRAGRAYSAKADRRTTGFVRAMLGAKQDYRYAAAGDVTGAAVTPRSYEHSGGKKGRRVHVAFTGEDVVTTATPSMGMGDPPATREQKAGALDQLSTIYAMAIGDGDPCRRTLHVYLDGRMLFDLVLSPNGTEAVSLPAFKGAARRCSVQFKPIAGFSDPQPPATMSFLFAPIGGFHAPIRIAMPTEDVGIVTLQATSFTAS